VKEEIEKVNKRVGNTRIIFSVSRLDYTKVWYLFSFRLT
jgi:trehalose-6-phosphate synthase